MTPYRIYLAFVLLGHVTLDRPAAAAEPFGESAAARLTRIIDQKLADDWTRHQIEPAARASDAEYLRRVSLDLIGRSPRVAETRAFLADSHPDKRARLVEELLKSPRFARHLAEMSRSDWLPQTVTNPQLSSFGFQLETWLTKQYAVNTPLDEIVQQLLTAEAYTNRGYRPAVSGRYDADAYARASFYQAHAFKPEDVAATVSRAFLGVRMECAQCHDHPFAAISRDRFWQLAAFFVEFSLPPPPAATFVGPSLPPPPNNRIQIAGTNRHVTATFPDGTLPTGSLSDSPRGELAAWLTASRNPYFARNMANRLWAHFFGIGIIDPVDDPSDLNPPSQPELLDALAFALVDSGFDQQVLIKAITASRAYNLTSRQSHPSQADPQRFARVMVRGLTANQIYDSFLVATGHRDSSPRGQVYFNPRDASGRAVFNNQFASTERGPEVQTSILQALLMMNSQTVADQTSVEKSEVLAAIVDAPFLNTAGKVETLYLAALSRRPTAEESERFTSYVDRGGPGGGTKQALADVFWVLLNSPEFLFNH